MKKALLTILIIILALAIAAGAFLIYSWQQITDDAVPKPEATVLGTPLTPYAYDWNEPFLGGLGYKRLAATADMQPAAPLATQPGVLPVLPPPGTDAYMTLTHEEAPVYDGPVDGFAADQYAMAPGLYRIDITASIPLGNSEGYGIFSYTCRVEVVPEDPIPMTTDTAGAETPDEPESKETAFIPGNTTLAQGDVFAMQVNYLPEGVAPTATTTLGPANFVSLGDGCWFAAVPIGNISIRSTLTPPGDYPVRVQAGEYSWDATVTVEAFDFIEQNLIIDHSDPVITEANSAEAYAQYNSTIPPLFSLTDDTKYWQGTFINPVEGDLSTEFGLTRYTNGDYSNPSRHPAVDIKAGEGTTVLAPNGGKVLFADYLLNTGYTIAIEHGGGLKSYYYHMSELNVEKDQIVAQGDTLGKVGSTGYSTGPHLHYEVRIGNGAISPTILSNPTCGLYSTGQGTA